MKRPHLSHRPARLLAKLRIWLAERRASIMIITALSAPLLIAATGLAVDVSYMYQEQVALQAAADAAALAVSNAAAKYGISTQANAATFATTGAGPYFAVAAANNATKSSYNFATSGNATISIATPTSSSGTNGTIWSWSATAQAPRGSFFSPVKGLGLYGLGMGFQAAGATADYVPGGSNICFIATPKYVGTAGVVYNGTQGYVEGSNCSLYAGATSGCPFNGSSSSYNSSGGGFVFGTAIDVPIVANETTALCANGSNKAYIGPTSTKVTNTNLVTGITAMPTAPADLVTFASVTPPSGASQITYANAVPTAPSGLTSEASPTSLYATDTNPLYLPVGYQFTGGTSGISPKAGLYIGTTGNSATLSTTGSTVITNGLGVNGSNTGNVYVGGAKDIISYPSQTGYALDLVFGYAATTAATPVTVNMFQSASGTLVVNGTTTIQQSSNSEINTTINLYQGNYYFNGNAGTATSCGTKSALCIQSSGGNSANSQIFSVAANSVFVVDGALGFTNQYVNDTNTFHDGTYIFNGPVSIAGASTTTFGDVSGTSTFWFNSGLSTSNQANIVFNPGIYYFIGGTLNLVDSNVTVNGATFVFEGSANYEIMDQGNTITMHAATSNCIAPGSYPVVTDNDGTGNEDGTGGKPICGVLIYQAPSDTTADGLENDTQNPPLYINGIIMQPGAELDLGANGSPGNELLEADPTYTSDDVLEMEVANLVDYGQTTLILTGGGGSGGSSISMLVK